MSAAEDGRGTGRVWLNAGAAKQPSASTAIQQHAHGTDREKLMVVLLTIPQVYRKCGRCDYKAGHYARRSPDDRPAFALRATARQADRRWTIDDGRSTIPSVQPERQQQIPCRNRHHLFAVDEIA